MEPEKTLRAARPPEKPVLVYDGACGFCRLWIERWRQATGEAVEYLAAPSPEAALRFPELEPERLRRSVQFVEPDGAVFEGAEAVFRAMGHGGSLWPLEVYRKVPPVAVLCEAVYSFVAARRPFFSRLTRLLWGKPVERPSFRLTREVFLRSLGLVYLIAFASFWVQADGLVGVKGILPLNEIMESAERHFGEVDWLRMPSLFWLNSSEAFLHGVCAAGALLAIAAMAGLVWAPAFALMWLLYLSLCHAGGPFMFFQWDILLLETGLLAVFFAPWRGAWSRARRPPPSPAALWLLRWLLFRLMFESGCVKLLSGDSTWRDWTALRFHYQTQPLPHALSWLAHQMPGWFQSLSVPAMFAVELGAPFLIFMPRRLRMGAFWMFAAFHLLIAATGNYGFFNLLSLVLCLLLFDDWSWERLLPRKLAARWRGGAGEEFFLRRPVFAAFAALVMLVSAGQILGIFGAPLEPLARLDASLAPFRSVNRYGLFAVMTTKRPEIIVEGSMDGRGWKPYAFRWKPGDASRRPGFAQPHMPRLDWQMWFAALGHWKQNPWALFFMKRLAEGEPSVLALLDKNPFPGEPPRYVRAMLYDYEFSSWEEWRSEGAWWRRTKQGLWCPVMTREGFAGPEGLNLE